LKIAGIQFILYIVKVPKSFKVLGNHQEFVGLIDEKDNEVKPDSGYVGESFSSEILGKYSHITLKVCAKGRRNNPQSDDGKANNREISRTRSRVEHIFGYMTRFMGGITTRVHGIDRVRQWMMLHLSQKIDIPLLLGYFEHIYKLPMKFFSTRKT
jgi:hypothetical protein